MDANELKKESAKKALDYINDGMIVGLGAGGSVAYLADYLSEKSKSGFNVKIVTPSRSTKLLCYEKGLNVLDTSLVSSIDVAFDGCDEVDTKLNALKSGGGVHTKEKLIGTMAKNYILLVDESKFSNTLTFKVPVVLEIIEEALSYIIEEVKKIGGEPKLRSSKEKDGFVITDNGNLLLDVNFKNVNNIESLDKALKDIRGVVETSLFVNVVTKAIVASENEIKVIE
ncbi:ribose-5-phosphate isomerase RpiA [Clostridium paridis]|uniref:Ribose 5-phosphate isomerase A n=1 Tax=Clostridium paridis TaxID=2803863 RepID=A0A937FGA1_9CLOT|nr:ribose-5-phosphate isomerase RpiA [Clostridium paridis]MBL4931473.1 ribose-5-phosphate isomerase RpiA [Clostridium paridis]